MQVGGRWAPSKARPTARLHFCFASHGCQGTDFSTPRTLSRPHMTRTQRLHRKGHVGCFLPKRTLRYFIIALSLLSTGKKGKVYVSGLCQLNVSHLNIL